MDKKTDKKSSGKSGLGAGGVILVILASLLIGLIFDPVVKTRIADNIIDNIVITYDNKIITDQAETIMPSTINLSDSRYVVIILENNPARTGNVVVYHYDKVIDYKSVLILEHILIWWKKENVSTIAVDQ